MSFLLEFNRFPSSDGIISFAEIFWDSEVFGFPVFELRLNDAPDIELQTSLPKWLNTLPKDTSSLVYTRIVPSDIAKSIRLCQLGFYPVEILIEVRLSIATLEMPNISFPKEWRLREFQEGDIASITSIAGKAFLRDRYHLDPNIPFEKASLRFERWISRGCHAEGELVYVYEDTARQRVIGFVHFRLLSPGVADMSLIAVHHEYHGGGAGSMMEALSLQAMRNQGIRIITGRKSINNPDVMATPKRGYRYSQRNPMLTFHRFSPPNPRSL